jgi:hypothetical protein
MRLVRDVRYPNNSKGERCISQRFIWIGNQISVSYADQSNYC